MALFIHLLSNPKYPPSFHLNFIHPFSSNLTSPKCFPLFVLLLFQIVFHFHVFRSKYPHLLFLKSQFSFNSFFPQPNLHFIVDYSLFIVDYSLLLSFMFIFILFSLRLLFSLYFINFTLWNLKLLPHFCSLKYLPSFYFWVTKSGLRYSVFSYGFFRHFLSFPQQ